MNRAFYRKIAKQNHVTAEVVKSEMVAAIKVAYLNPTAKALMVPRKGEVPTPDELIYFTVGELQYKQKGKC